MLYYLFEYLEKQYQLPGAGLFQFLTFRSAMAVLLSLLIAMIYGKRVILFLQAKQIGESVRDLGLEGQKQKAGTPTMGGLIIIISTLLPVILFADIKNIYVILLIVTTVWMGIIGFVDDYIKIFKKNKWSGTVGLRYEHSNSIGNSVTLDSLVNRKISKLFPSFSLSCGVSPMIFVCSVFYLDQ